MDDTGIERANIFGVSEGGSNKPKPTVAAGLVELT